MEIEKDCVVNRERFGKRYTQAILLSLCALIGFSIRLSLTVALVDMTDVNSTSNKDVYQWGAFEQSMILSSFYFGEIVLMIPSGYLSTIWSAQKLVSISLLSSGFLHSLTPIIVKYGDWKGMCGSRVFMGFFQTCFMASIHTLVARWSMPTERSFISGIIGFGYISGSIFATAVSGFIAASPLGWQGIFYIFGVAGMAASSVAFLNIFDSPIFHPSISVKEKNMILESLQSLEDDRDEKLKVPWGKIAKSRAMWANVVGNIGFITSNTIMMMEIPIYMRTVIKLSISENGIAGSITPLIMAILIFPSGWLADRAIRKGMSVANVRRVWNTIGTCVPALGLIGMCYLDRISRFWTVVLSVASASFGVGAMSGFHVNHIDLSPKYAGTLMSISNCVATIFSALTPLACGAIIKDQDDTDSWHVVFGSAAFILILTNFIFSVFCKGNTQDWNDPVIR